MTEFQSFRRIPEFPDYMIGSNGDVYNQALAHWMTLSPTEHGDLTVGLVRNGRQFRRSVKVLVARAFVPGEGQVFNTPIQLDNDKNNLRAENLAWRPRWFAWQYSRQFVDPPEVAWSGPVVEVNSGQVFENILEAAAGTGSLIRDIRMSLLNKTRVFPHEGIFAYRY